MGTREPTFAEIVDAAKREAAERPAVKPKRLPPVLPRLVEDGFLSPTGRMYWDLDGPLVGMQEMRQVGLDGAAMIINPLGEGYTCVATLEGERNADLQLEWFEPDLVREAAERSEPICRRHTIVCLLEDDEGHRLLHVDGDGLIWPPIARSPR